MRSYVRVLPLVLLLLCSSALAQTPVERKRNLDRIGHIIVVLLENRSFDHLYGLFPGADGIDHSGNAMGQVDQKGQEFVRLPGVINTNIGAQRIDTRFAFGFPNGPFRVDRYVSLEEMTGDLVHRFYQEQEQIDGGRMDKFVAISDAGSLPMGYIDGRSLPLYQLAEQYTLLDHFFHAAFGGGFLNRFWLVCACTPRYEPLTDELVVQLDYQGHMTRDGAITPDGYAVNTIEPASALHDPRVVDQKLRLPPQTMRTIGHLLTDAGVSWAWYLRAASLMRPAGHPATPSFIYHHQPFAYFAEHAVGTPGQAEHLKDQRDMMRAIDNRTLPAVTFYQPIGADDEHPGYANLMHGDDHAALIVRATR